MYTSRPYDRDDTRATIIMTGRRGYSSASAWPTLFILLSLSSYHERVGATPTGRPEAIERRDEPKDATLSPKVWVPVAGAIILFTIIGIMSWRRKTGSLFSFSGAGAGAGSLPGGRTRELTAEQLAGTINNGGRREVTATELAGDNSGPPRPARRTRRPRRTPSQMSVTSLPAYNKEPGDEELVIFRGRDMEDVTMPAAVVRTSGDGDDDDSMDHSRDHSRASRYSEMPTSPHDMPLLQNDEGDLSLQSLQPEAQTRRSFDTGSPETSSLMRSNSRHSTNQPDPRGDAPAYFEVVDQSTVNLNNAEQANTTTPPSTSPEPQAPARRSGFRTLLNRISIGPNGHTRNPSSGSVLSSNMSHGHSLEPTTSRMSHRTTPSGGSGFMFRTISRQRSINTLNNSTSRLNSPSMISLSSISAPLTHTATRSEITYPRSGPTAEQLKVISSRETFTRFGMPYGADAIAFASSSRLDLVPPPDFETVTNERSASPGPSRLRSVSNVALTAAPPTQSAHSHSASTGNAILSSKSASSAPAITSAQPEASDTDGEKTTSEVTATSTPQATISSISKNHYPTLDANQNEDPQLSHTQNKNKQSSLSSQSATILPTSPPPVIGEFGTLAVPAASGATSYSKHTGTSISSFATAAESMTPSTRTNARTVADADAEFFDAESDFDSAPSTPRIGGQHALEATDVTISQSSATPSSSNA